MPTCTGQAQELSSTFFGEDNCVKDKVRAAILRVVNALREKIPQEVDIEAVHLVGSLTGANWDKHSDVDIHPLVDFSRYDDPDRLRELLGLIAQRFNQNGFRMGGHQVEVYFQSTGEPNDSPGVYDVTNGFWQKEPEGVSIDVPPEVDRGAKYWRFRVNDLAREFNRYPKSLESLENYTVRANNLFEQLRNMRKTSIAEEGREGVGNLIFKSLRRNGTLAMLKKVIRDATDLSFEPTRV